MKERWEDIKGYNAYQVSDRGRIKSHNGRWSKKSKILKPVDNSYGYKRVTLVKGGEKKNVYIHRIVAETFIPNPNRKRCINHKDGNKSNNRSDNIEWCTHQENTEHMYKKLGVRMPSGENHWASKLTNKEVLEIRVADGTQKEIASKYGISRSAVSFIKNKKRWRWL